jgi:hypothetical protein
MQYYSFDEYVDAKIAKYQRILIKAFCKAFWVLYSLVHSN